MDQGSALQMLWLLEDLFRANWGHHRPHPSPRPIRGGAEGYAGQPPAAINVQAGQAARPQQSHDLALADARVLDHRKQQCVDDFHRYHIGGLDLSKGAPEGLRKEMRE